MDRRHLTGFFLFWLTLGPLAAAGQDVASFPKLHPSSITAYDLDEGLPISCTWFGLVDQRGRLWINPCYSSPEYRFTNFYLFNGRRAKVIELADRPAGINGQAALAGMTETGELFGYFRETDHFFLFDPDTHRARYYRLGIPDAVIFFMENSPEHGLVLLAASSRRQYVFRLREDKLEQLLDYQSAQEFHSVFNPLIQLPNYQVLSGDDLWFLDVPDIAFEVWKEQEQLRLLRFDLRRRVLSVYTYNDLFGGNPPPWQVLAQQISLAADGRGQVYLSGKDRVYRVDPASGKAVLHGVFPHADFIEKAQGYRVEKDEAGNLLFLFPDGPKHYLGVLMDTTGQYFNYSDVLEKALGASRFQFGWYFHLKSRDFRKDLLAFTDGGVVAADLRPIGLVSSYLAGFATRAITEWRPGQYLVRPEGENHFRLIRPNASPSEEPFGPSFPAQHSLHPATLSNLVRQGYQYWWYSDGCDLVRINSNQEYTIFPVGIHFEKFLFWDERTVLVVESTGFVYRYDLQTQKLSPLEADGSLLRVSGYVNELYASRDSTLWIASLEGLWRIDLKAATSRRIGLPEGFLDGRMMSINEDSLGRLWVGTYGGGLHIYDPASGAIRVTNEEKGLSNNTVIGILPDDEGVRWIATYKGINLVSPEGEVLAQLFAEDGLSSDELNRYSYYKDSRGRLLFGSINGVSIIDPEMVKRHLDYFSDQLQINLTSIRRYDSQREKEHTWYFGFDRMGDLFLPAAHRFLELNFALSSMLRPEDQRFAYKIERTNSDHSTDWLSLGSKPQLYLPDLAPGHYRILIRGSDCRGNWTASPIAVEVRVGRFFYQQPWFYLLWFLAFAGAVYAWFRRQRLLRKALEAELAKRTTEIMAARDQLIVQEKLASLGQMTAGIAHEIKNPLNFVNNFAQGSSEILDELAEELRRRAMEAGQEVPGPISSSLELLKENIEFIHGNGARLDEIVTGMMNHARNTSAERQMTEINQLVEANVNLAYYGFKGQHPGFQAGIRRDYQTPGLLLPVFPNDLGRCLINILNNACYAVHQRSSLEGDGYEPAIRVSTFAHPDRAEIRIRDNGPGIPEEAKAKIFTPFYTTKPTGTGNVGLGLSICYDIVVQEHQGRLDVNSVEGEFTEFVISLPRRTRTS